MAIGIKGIRVSSITIGMEDGKQKVTGSYELVSTSDKVLAKQSFGGYSDMNISPAADTIGALDAFLKLYKRDIHTVIGLESE